MTHGQPQRGRSSTRFQASLARPIVLAMVGAALMACGRGGAGRAVTVERAPAHERTVDASTSAARDGGDDAAIDAAIDATVHDELADGATTGETRIPRGWIDEALREPNIEQRLANEYDRQQCTPLPSPRLEAVPAELRDEVERLRPRARELLRCYNGGYRVTRRPDARCDPWTSELIASGVAAAHATGIELTTLNAPRRGMRCGSPFEGSAADRAAYVIARTGELRSMAYLLRYLAMQIPIRGGYPDDRSISLVFESVYRMALRSLGPPRDSTDEAGLAEYQRERLRRWGQWLVLHGDERREQWREPMLAAQRRRILVNDIYSRLTAAQMLEPFEAERPLVDSAIERACREIRESRARGEIGSGDGRSQYRLCDLRRNPFDDPR